jgi:hypothetical protein
MTMYTANNFVKRLLDEGLLFHAESLAGMRGEIAAFVFEPEHQARQAARALGWDGKRPLFKLGTAHKKALARADHVTKTWVETPHTDTKVLVIAHSGTLLLNFTPELGWHLEPGSLGADVLN